MPSKIDYIQELTFFKSLDKEQISALSEISNITTHAKNSILYYENDMSNKIFFLASGTLKIYKIDKFGNEIFLYNIYANSLISELTTLDTNAIHCFSNAEFLEESAILEVSFLDFKNLFLSKNILIYEFINEMLLKNHQLQCVVNRELVFDATAKVAYMLSDDLTIFNKLKRQEVSFMLHIQPETLSRVLKRLRRSDIIDIQNSDVVILDKDALQAIYKGE
ncbi:MAG: Crp/Fnr family transcriptional regulator [Sulfurimonas sp.]|nr:Crp/Fnr family transcriptional regulator [Sulfurimonas sp.]